jgi:hypothetical protein
MLRKLLKRHACVGRLPINRTASSGLRICRRFGRDAEPSRVQQTGTLRHARLTVSATNLSPGAVISFLA